MNIGLNKQKLILVLIFPIFMIVALFIPIHAGQKVQKPKSKQIAGKKLVQKLCLFCHSEAAVSLGKVKHWNQLISQLSPHEFHNKVKEGITPIMPGFSEITEEQTINIYTFLQQDIKSSEHQGAFLKERGKKHTPGSAVTKISQSRLEEKLSTQLRCPCCGKQIKDCSCGMVPKIRSEIRHLEKMNFGEGQIKKALVKRYGNKILPISEISETLSPEPFYKVAKAYKTAKQNPEILEEISCFCPCYRAGHTNLLDCYKDKHAAQCQICLDEALTVQHLMEHGVAEDEIVQTIHEKYRPKASTGATRSVNDK